MLSALVSAFVSLFSSRNDDNYISMPNVRRLDVRESIRRGFTYED